MEYVTRNITKASIIHAKYNQSSCVEMLVVALGFCADSNAYMLD